MPRAGYIEPGETEQFFISFYPECAGVFTRAWFLDFSPKLLTPIKPLNLLGIAVAECRNRFSAFLKSKNFYLKLIIGTFVIYHCFSFGKCQCTTETSKAES